MSRISDRSKIIKMLFLAAALCLCASRAALCADGAVRILSMSPSATETLFALGLSGDIVGVTRYCDYPPEANELPRVCTVTDISPEALISVSPDIVITSDLSASVIPMIEKLGFRTFTMRFGSIDELCASIEGMADACGAHGRGSDLSDSIRRSAEETARAVAGLDRPSVLLSIGRDITESSLSFLYAAGSGSIYDEMIRIAGGVNALGGSGAAYPRLSAEGLITADPDVIIDLVGKHIGTADAHGSLRQWASLPLLRARDEGRLYIKFGDDALRPGPRTADVIRQFAAMIHPELGLELTDAVVAGGL